MKKLANLEIFAAVATQRSFSRAAERLGLPKSSVSRKIAELEIELGVRLIHRDNRHFELTDQGALLLEAGEDVLRRAELAFDEVRSVHQGLRGLISITASSNFAQIFLADPIADFKRENPEVRIHFDVTPRQLDLVSDRFDLAVRVGPLKDSSLVARKLCDRPLGLFASVDYLKRNGTPKKPKDLEAHDFISTARTSIASVALRPSIQVNSMGLVREFVLRGLGVGLMDPAAIAPEQRKLLVPLLTKIALPRVPIYLVFPHSKPPRKVSELVKKIVEHQQGK